MSNESYNNFCPIAMACEIIEPRWTLLVLCEMWSGSTRFNEIRRGVPGMSPTLLSKRLKEMENQSLITREEDHNSGTVNYKITSIADELMPIIYNLGKWAHRNIDSEVTLENLDSKLLMWNIRRKVDASKLPSRKTVIQFIFPELDKNRDFWLIHKPGFTVDLCTKDPAFDVNLYVKSDLKTLTAVWIGLAKLSEQITDKNIVLIGDENIAKKIGDWLVRSAFAPKCMY
ncbi:MAG: helix-turn-helix transcriptional regulator [Kangiellaceae bacterium]|nr:helix-turn-helix transcriptional regulator [Kangiellaceae bacterium]